MEANERPRVLCVDDEVEVLEGLTLHLRRHCLVYVATSGAAALDLLRREPPFTVLICDMRMPQMSGAEFLAQVCKLSPDTIRMLLTGHAEVDAAIAAVNDGQIFRFLTKPCPPRVLLDACAAAVAQHRLVSAEKILLEQTLRGSVMALAEILALTKPAVFGRAMRIRRRASDLSPALAISDPWQVEVAAVLSQIGYLTLRVETVDRLYQGQALTPAEQEVVDQLPRMAERMISHIPRLERVREILIKWHLPFELAHASGVPIGARLLKVVHDFDVLDSQGLSAETAVGVLASRLGTYDPAVVSALRTHLVSQKVEIAELPLRELRAGMILAADVLSTKGVLLVARGYDVSKNLLERIRNLPSGLVCEPLRIYLNRSSHPHGD